MAPSAPDSGDDLLVRLERPLSYALRNPSRVKDLESSLAGLLQQAPKAKRGNWWVDFRGLCKGLDQLDPEARLQRIRALLSVLERWKQEYPRPRLESVAARNANPEAARNAKRSAARNANPAAEQSKNKVETAALPLQYLKGVGPWVAEKLSHQGILSAEDLLFHLPHRYEDRRDFAAVSSLTPGQRATVMGEIVVAGAGRPRHSRMRTYEMIVDDGTGTLTAKWFHYQGDWLEKRFHQGQKVILNGVPRLFGGKVEMQHPDAEVVEQDEDPSGFARLIPIYPSTEGLFQKTIRGATAQALEKLADQVPDALPAELCQRRQLLPLAEALRQVHFPPQEAVLEDLNQQRSPGHRRLIYDEFFFLEVGLALQRQGVIEEPAIPVSGGGRLMDRLRERLPFTLTGAQERVLGEILADLKRPHPMHRLLQGDVGSGKTVVAVLAALAAIEDGLQAAIMAPTEILSEQHYLTMHRFMEDVGARVVLLSAAVRGAARKKVLAQIAAGSVDIVVGTHAVIQDKVEFKRLGLGIVDEQHRFGVLQRAKLRAKAMKETTPHVLVMTATPIPRTLAMTAYGDLDLSVIDEKPPGRQRVTTRIFPEKKRAEVYRLVREQVEQGRQAFVVYPLVEESETLDLKDATRMAEHFQREVFPDLRVGLLHGRMKTPDKEAVMRAVVAGGIQILVATTVIEVGIDVPNATVMLVENAERFGLSQLHQMRGRIGRGPDPSSCLLLAQYTRSDDAWRRLRVMEETDDGFRIAEEDLAIRGPGELLGTRQSGVPDFRVASLARDAKVLSEAREDAFALVREDPELSRPEHRRIREVLLQRWGKRLRLARVG